ncbi:hypothetical protein BDP27DRAFT_1422395 [Rhodocollybia butyracea]|uniref:Uncharacterized protein n=1 Tax=Rhodocollybia butyracea TaxID=206335 RepID=A0A9P5PRC8_9AGAR|nr:hypothetical protein BDP27DRAFT_1422395 [Rhodocollybia butyracea]
MVSVAKIVFPRPPPTTNALSSQQRTQLMRSTKKLGRVLGITPQLIDVYPNTPSSSTEWLEDDDFYRPKSRGSVDSTSSGSSLNTRPRSRWSSRPSSRQNSRTSSPSSHSSRSASSAYTDDILLNNDAKPLLRLAMTSPSLGNQTRSPLDELLFYSDDELDSNAEDLRYTIRPTLEPSRDSFAASPAFHIPSSNSLRMAKMDRIRRKLGDDVPLQLVFPDEEDVESVSVDSCSTSLDKPFVTVHWSSLPPLPIEEPAITIGHNRLSNTRDSLLIPTYRQVHRIKRKPVPNFDLDKPEISHLSLDAERHREKERLSLILELPHEHDGDSEEEVDMPATPQADGSLSVWFNDCGEDFSNSDYHSFLKYIETDSI